MLVLHVVVRRYLQWYCGNDTKMNTVSVLSLLTQQQQHLMRNNHIRRSFPVLELPSPATLSLTACGLRASLGAIFADRTQDTVE